MIHGDGAARPVHSATATLMLKVSSGTLSTKTRRSWDRHRRCQEAVDRWALIEPPTFCHWAGRARAKAASRALQQTRLGAIRDTFMCFRRGTIGEEGSGFPLASWERSRQTGSGQPSIASCGDPEDTACNHNALPSDQPRG